MKTDVGHKIRLGIFLSIGIAAFIIGIYFIGEGQHLFSSSFRVNATFRHVAGLQPGNNVRLSGINVGTVDKISISSDTTVLVEVLIDEITRKFIMKDAVATIGSEGLMGNKTLIIQPGTGAGAGIEDNDTIASVPPMNVDDILVSLKTVVDNTSRITQDLSMMTSSLHSGEGKVNLEEILVSIRATIDNASSITNDLSAITHNIQSGKGTLGRLLMDSTVAQNIDSTVVNLKRSSESLKNLVSETERVVSQNLDSTAVNLKEGSADFRTLMKLATNSWLTWFF